MWRLPAQATVVALAAVSVFTIALLGTWSMLSWPFQEWVRTSAAFHQQTAISLPVVGAVATLVAVRGARSRNHGAMSPVRPLLVLHLGVVVAHLAGLVPLVVATVVTARAGGPDLAAMLTGPLGLTAATACGYVVGLHWRSLLAVPVTAVLLTAATLFGTATDAAAAVVPVQYMTAALGQQPSAPIVMYRLAFLVIVTITASWLTVRRRRSPGANGALLVAGVIVAVAVVVPVTTTPALFALDRDPPRTCTARAGVDYCVHSGHQEVLGELVDGMTRLATRYGPLTVRLDRTYDVALAGATGLVADSDQERTLWYDIRPDLAPSGELPVIADLLAGVGACGPGSTDATAYARQLGRWLVAKDAATNAFHGVRLGVMHDWIVRNQPAINACAIHAGLLPRS